MCVCRNTPLSPRPRRVHTRQDAQLARARARFSNSQRGFAHFAPISPACAVGGGRAEPCRGQTLRRRNQQHSLPPITAPPPLPPPRPPTPPTRRQRHALLARPLVPSLLWPRRGGGHGGGAVTQGSLHCRVVVVVVVVGGGGSWICAPGGGGSACAGAGSVGVGFAILLEILNTIYIMLLSSQLHSC